MKCVRIFTLFALFQFAVGFRYPSPINYYNYNKNHKDPETTPKAQNSGKGETLSFKKLLDIRRLIEKSMLEVKNLPYKVLKKKEKIAKQPKRYENFGLFKKNPRIQ